MWSRSRLAEFAVLAADVMLVIGLRWRMRPQMQLLEPKKAMISYLRGCWCRL